MLVLRSVASLLSPHPSLARLPRRQGGDRNASRRRSVRSAWILPRI